MSFVINKRLKLRLKKSLIIFAMILVTLNGMLPSFSMIVQAEEIGTTEAIEQPNITKDVDGEKSKEIQKGTDYLYSINVELPENISGYETMEISDDLDKRLVVQKTDVLINGDVDETFKVVVEGEKVSLALMQEQLQALAGKEVKLQITTLVKEDAATADKIENVAQIVINDDLIMETNPAVVTPIDLEEKDQAEPIVTKEEKDQLEPDEQKEEKDQLEPDEQKEEKDQVESTVSKEDGGKNIESNDSPSTKKSARASFNINSTDSYASVVNYGANRFRLYQLDATSTVVKASINLTLPAGMTYFNGLAVSKDNFIYIMSSEDGAKPRLLKINSAGKVVRTFNPSLAPKPTVAATMIDNKYYYIIGTTLYYYDVVTNQQGSKDLVNTAGAPLTGLGADLIADADGYLWVSQKDNLLQVNPTTGGIIRALPVPGLSAQLPVGVRGMSFLADGRILITSNGYNEVNTRFTVDKNGKLTKLTNMTGIPTTHDGIGDLGSAVRPVFEPLPPLLESDKEVKIAQKGLGNRVNQIPDQIQTGDILTYTIRARNTKPAPSILKGLSITDTLPAGVEYVPGTLMIDNKPMSDSTGDDEGQFVNGTVTGNIGDIIDTNYHTLSFQVKVLPGYENSSVLNTATVDAVNANPQNPTAEFVVKPGNADITLEKAVDHDTAYVGDTLTYTLKASNSSTGGAWNGTIADNLPEGLELVSGTTQLNGTALADEDVWTDSQLSVQDVALKAGETATVTFQVKVLASLVNQTISNVATADDPSDSDDPIDSNEVKTPILFKNPVLQSEKSSKIETKASGNTDADHPEVGDILLYTIKTQNTIKDSLVENLVISDTIPEGLEYVEGSLQVDGKSVTDAEEDDDGHAVNGEIAGQFGDIEDTEWHTLEFLVIVKEGQAGEDIKNIATIDGANIDEPDKPEEEVKIYPREPKLESEKSSINAKEGKEKYEVGDTIIYTIKTRNKVSDSLVGNLAITDKLPAGLEYVADSLKVSHEGTGEFKDGTITATFGDVKDTEWRTVTFEAKIKSGQSDKEIKNTAKVTVDEIEEPEEPTTTVKVDPKDPKLDSQKSSKLEQKAEGNTDAENPEVGDTIRYTITTKNTIEDSLVKNLIITDTIPDGLTYVAGSLEVDGEPVTDAKDDDAGHVVGGKVIGTFGDVTDTKEHTVTFLVTIDKGQAGEDIKNIATIDGANIDEPDKPEEEVKIYPREPKLESEKSSINAKEGKEKYEVGDTIIYTIKTRNKVSDSLVSNLTIEDTLPEGLELIVDSLEVSHDGTAEENNGVITAKFGEVTDTEWRTVTFEAKIKSGQSGKEIKNTAKVTIDEIEEPEEPTTTVKIDPKDPKLDSKKSSKLEQKAEGNTDTENPEVGDTIRYTITTKNTIEDSLVKNLIITDTIPDGLTYVAGSLEVDGEPVTDAKDDDAGHVVNGEIAGQFGDIEDTEWHTLEFLVIVKEGQAGEDIKNIAIVNGDNIDEPDKPEEEVKIYPREPKLESEKSSTNAKEGKETFEVDDTIVYTIKTRNKVSDSLVENLTITDKLPAGLEYVADSLKVSHEGTGEFKDGTITATFGDVKDTEWRTVTFEAKIKSGQSEKTIENIASIDGDNIDEPDKPSEKVTVDPKVPVLKSEKSSKLEAKAEGNTDKDNPEVGDTLLYTIKTQNTIADSLVKNLVISDEIPEGLEYVADSLKVDGQSVTDSKGDDKGYAVDGKIVGKFGNIKDTDWHTVEFLVKVKSGQSGKDIKNIAVVGGDNIEDPDEPEEEVKIYPRESKLDSQKSSKLEQKAEGNTDAENPEVGDTIRYTITTKNTIEDSLIKNLIITDTIPEGLTYVAGSLEVDGEPVTDAKDDDAGHVVGGKVIGTFGDVTDTKEHTVTFLVTIDKGQAGEDIKNIATIDGDNIDEPDKPEEEVKIYPREPKLESEKSSINAKEGKEKYEVGDTIIYTIKTRNKVSDSLVGNLAITDKLPAGLEYVADSLKVSHEGTGEFKDGAITATFGDVKDTEWRTVTFEAKIKSGQSGKEIKNTAKVTVDEIEEPEEPTTTVKVDPKDPKLDSQKSSKLEQKAEGNTDAENPEVGDTIRYTITTKNTIEDSLVKNLIITDTIPDGLTYVAGSLEVDGEPVTDAKDDDAGHVVGGKVIGTFGDVTDTKEHTVTFLVTIDKGQSGEDIKNIAVVGGDNIEDPDEPEEEVKIYPRESKLDSQKSSKLEQKAEGNTDAENPEVGDTIRYTITTKNTIEDSLVKNLIITDTIPDGLTYVAGSLEVDGEPVTDAKDDDAGHVVGGKVIGTFGDVTDTKEHTVTFLVTIDKGQSGKDIKNIAVVGGDNIEDPDEPEEEVKIYPRESKLESEKSAVNAEKGKETFEVDDTIVYTIKTRNKVSDSLVENLTITDKLPAGLEYVADSLKVSHEGTGEFKDGTITATFGDVKDTEWRTVTFEAKIKSGQSEKTIENIASIDGDNIDEPDKPSEKVTVDPKAPVLKSEKSSKLEAKAEGNTDKDNPEVGDTLRYTIKTQNKIADSLVKNLVISDEIPEGLEYVADSLKVDGQSVTDSKDDDKGYAVDGKIIGQFGNIKDTNWHTVEFLVKVKSGQSGKDIKNIAVVGGDNIEDPDEPEEEVKIYPRESKLESEKSAINAEKGKETFEVDDTIVYTIKTRNKVSDSLVENLTITDKLPAGLEYVADSLKVSHEGTGEFKDGTITATFGDVKDTEWRTVTFEAKIKSGQSEKTIENIASIDGDNIDEPDKPSEKVTVDPKAPVLESEKSSKLEAKAEGNTDKDNPEVGDTLRYTIKTQNTIADSLVKSLVISDEIPEGLEYVADSLKVDGQSVTDSKDDDKGYVVDGKIVGKFGNIKDTNWHTVEFLVKVKSGQSGKDIKNIAVVDGDNIDKSDKPEEVVQVYPRHTVLESEKLAMNLEKGKDTFKVGDTVVYTIKARNTVSDSLVENLKITDKLPEGLEYVDGSLEVSHEGTGDFKDGTITATFGDVKDTEWRIVTFKATIQSEQSGETIKNIATVSSDNVPDSNYPEAKIDVDPKDPAPKPEPKPDPDPGVDNSGDKTSPPKTEKEEGEKLPNTATNIFNYGLFGVIAVLAGLIGLRRRKSHRN